MLPNGRRAGGSYTPNGDPSNPDADARQTMARYQRLQPELTPTPRTLVIWEGEAPAEPITLARKKHHVRARRQQRQTRSPAESLAWRSGSDVCFFLAKVKFFQSTVSVWSAAIPSPLLYLLWFWSAAIHRRFGFFVLIVS